MARFERIPIAQADSELRPLYDQLLKDGFGQDEPWGFFSAQSLRPDLLKTVMGLVRGILMEGQLPPSLKQMILVAVSAQNSCRYCAITHARALEGMGVSSEVIESLGQDATFSQVSPAQRPVLQFAVRCAQNPAALTNSDFEELYELGFTPEEVMEVVMTSVFTIFVNGWADASGVEVDPLDPGTDSSADAARCRI